MAAAHGFINPSSLFLIGTTLKNLSPKKPK